MGAWGSGNFDNDDALDWVALLTDSYHLELLYEALVAVPESPAEYIELPMATKALAAAEIVAAQLDRPVARLPKSVAEWVRFAPAPTPRLVGLARRAVGRVAEASELRDLWAETSDFEAWQSEMRDLVGRLSASDA
jgi:hypothetical protein